MQTIESQYPEGGFFHEALRQAYFNYPEYDEEVPIESLHKGIQLSFTLWAQQKFAGAAIYLVAHGYCRTIDEAVEFLDSCEGRYLFEHLTRFTSDGDLNSVAEKDLLPYLPQKPTRRARNSKQSQHGFMQVCLAI
jgi:hypothetical protein